MRRGFYSFFRTARKEELEGGEGGLCKQRVGSSGEIRCGTGWGAMFHVKHNPMVWRWGGYNRAFKAAAKETAPLAGTGAVGAMFHVKPNFVVDAGVGKTGHFKETNGKPRLWRGWGLRGQCFT